MAGHDSRPLRVLLSTGSSARYMAPPNLGEDQVVCGPDWPDAWAGGRATSLASPSGRYDLGALARRLPSDQQPDVVVCLVDASLRNEPRNLGRFACPKVLLVADTHHLDDPIVKLVRYARSEPFDRVVLVYDRHHHLFFRAAGIASLFWFPGLTFPHGDAEVRAARSAARARGLAFVGQASDLHPRRARLAAALAASGLPFEIRRLSQADGLRFYGGRTCGFNASLNADLNLRVFEILASGAALLTDALGKESGLDAVGADGRELLTYRSEEDLIEKARALMADPRLAEDIGRRGAAWFDTHFSAEARRSAFRALAFDGVAPATFPLPSSAETPPSEPDKLKRTIRAYQKLQEMHRVAETAVISAPAALPSWARALCETLPRIRWAPEGAPEADFRGASLDP